MNSKALIYLLLFIGGVTLLINHSWNQAIKSYEYFGNYNYTPSLPLTVYCQIGKMAEDLPIASITLLMLYNIYEWYEDFILSMKNVDSKLVQVVKVSRYLYLAQCSSDFAKEFLPKAIALMHKGIKPAMDIPSPSDIINRIQQTQVPLDNNIVLDAGLYQICIEIKNNYVVNVREGACKGYVVLLNPLTVHYNKLDLVLRGIYTNNNTIRRILYTYIIK